MQQPQGRAARGPGTATQCAPCLAGLAALHAPSPRFLPADDFDAYLADLGSDEEPPSQPSDSEVIQGGRGARM